MNQHFVLEVVGLDKTLSPLIFFSFWSTMPYRPSQAMHASCCCFIWEHGVADWKCSFMQGLWIILKNIINAWLSVWCFKIAQNRRLVVLVYHWKLWPHKYGIIELYNEGKTKIAFYRYFQMFSGLSVLCVSIKAKIFNFKILFSLLFDQWHSPAHEQEPKLFFNSYCTSLQELEVRLS